MVSSACAGVIAAAAGAHVASEYVITEYPIEWALLLCGALCGHISMCVLDVLDALALTPPDAAAAVGIAYMAWYWSRRVRVTTIVHTAAPTITPVCVPVSAVGSPRHRRAQVIPPLRIQPDSPGRKVIPGRKK